MVANGREVQPLIKSGIRGEVRIPLLRVLELPDNHLSHYMKFSKPFLFDFIVIE